MGARVTAVVGDIVHQPDCDAIVNAANPQLLAGGGVCGAIHRAAGPELEDYAVNLGPIDVGASVITPGFRLPNRWVIHVVGPRYFADPDPAALLAKAVRSVLALAEKHGATRVALPAISTGIYGYPLEEAGPIMVAAAKAMAPTLAHVEEVRFVLVHAGMLRWFDPT
ncbi:macro domain-containing protein [Sulfurisoma sediminicola]|uniref:O-acetyl-ADP-ribose deacetylase (Regulator of RNase III) n=1 Tax=Sulfurisoma sediminicola TaxID=1381557 RepID=A0A497XDQ0_9PROT|nr:macro domain-containing protein [Sulfurisoma sediminicola]RLJ64796.1 O-acetyl-ADP-ribose deacetylase (regulator of RNase III) [Sulfurisoma sediminicola]